MARSLQAAFIGRARGVAVLAVGVLVAGVLVVEAEAGGASSTTRRIAFGPFAGYAWTGRVSSVAGAWTVPTIVHANATAGGATWIGAQSPAADSPFIQVGVNEFHIALPQTHISRDFYVAFWSDTAHHFHPAKLFDVRPGDQITARLALRHRRWAVAIADTSSNARATFVTREDTAGAFNVAEWTQEDVSSGDPPKPLPYPRLSTVRFRDVTVNSAPPAASGIATVWMSLGSRVLAPDPLRHDSFVLEVRSPIVSAEGERFLRIAAPFDAAESRFHVELAGWTATTPSSTVGADSSRMQAALRANLDAFERLTWPKVSNMVAALIRSLRVALNHLPAVAHLPPGRIRSWQTAWSADNQAIGRASRPIARLLGIPEIQVVDPVTATH